MTDERMKELFPGQMEKVPEGPKVAMGVNGQVKVVPVNDLDPLMSKEAYESDHKVSSFGPV